MDGFTVEMLDYEDGYTGTLLLAVSGGPDSMALLRAFQKRGQAPFFVAHLNHQLRGPESDADQAFVAQYCRDNGLDFCTASMDVRGIAEQAGDNLESTARRVRYDWLIEVARAGNCRFIATGHTADDQAETVLHHLLRGTGLRGLRGVAPRRPLANGMEVIRPLLGVTRKQIMEFLEAENIPFREDATNFDPQFTRNRIRHELLPLVREKYSPEIDSLLCTLAEQAADAYQRVEAEVLTLLKAAERPRAGATVVLDAAALSNASRNMVRELFHYIWEREGWPTSAMNFAAWDRLAGLVFDADKAHDLPGGVQGRRKERVVQLKRGHSCFL